MAAFGSETIRREIEKQFRIPLKKNPTFSRCVSGGQEGHGVVCRCI